MCYFEYDEEAAQLRWLPCSSVLVHQSDESLLSFELFLVSAAASWTGRCLSTVEAINPWRTLKIGGCFELLPVCMISE